MLKTLLFIDPVTGEQLFYEELRERVSAGAIDYAPFVQPGTAREATIVLLTAVILGQSLTLFDSDFSAEERDALGGNEAQLSKRIRIAGGSWTDVAAMLKEVRRQTGFTQTGFTLTLFTSGTTGRPKQVTHDLEGLTRMLKVSVAHEPNVWGLAYNPTHIAGVQVILQAFFNGNPLVNIFQASRETIVGVLGDYKVSHLSATPSFYRLLLPIAGSIPSVRAVALGGEPSDERLVKQLRAAFPSARVRNLYASTEAGTLLVSEGDTFVIPPELSDRVVVREGRLWVHRSLLGEFGKKLKVESGKRKGEQLNSGTVRQSDSEVLGSQVCPSSAQGHPSSSPLRFATGHSADQQSTTPVRPPVPPKAGDLRAPRASSGFSSQVPDFSQVSGFKFQLSDWYDTGDVVEILSKDPFRFKIIARDRDWVNVGGHKVNPHEVEDVLRRHPDIREARVFGRKNSVMGQVLCAEVVAASPLENRETVRRLDGDAVERSDGDEARERGVYPPLAAPGATRDGAIEDRALKCNERVTDAGAHRARRERTELNGEAVKQLDGDAVERSDGEAVKQLDGGEVAESVKESDGLTDLGTHGLTEVALRAWLGERLQPVKVPRLINFVDSISQTRTGKQKR